MFSFKKKKKNIETDLSLLTPAKKKSTPSTVPKGHPDRKRLRLCNCYLTHHLLRASIQKELFIEQARRPQASMQGVHYFPVACWRLPSEGVSWDLSNGFCLPEIIWHPKPYCLGEKNPIIPCVHRGQQPGKVPSPLEIKLSNLCW